MILPHSVDISKGLTISHMATHPPNARYPDATAITYDEKNFKVTVVYNDHSIYVWDVRDIKKVYLTQLQNFRNFNIGNYWKSPKCDVLSKGSHFRSGHV